MCEVSQVCSWLLGLTAKVRSEEWRSAFGQPTMAYDDRLRVHGLRERV